MDDRLRRRLRTVCVDPSTLNEAAAARRRYGSSSTAVGGRA